MNNLLFKTLLRIALPILFIFTTYGFVSSNYGNAEITISDVVHDPNVKMELVSIGGHSGKCVQLKITSNKTFKLQIPAGTIYEPPSKNEQKLLAPMLASIQIKRNTPKKIALDGYCTQLSNRSPKNGGNFKLNKTKDSSLQQLILFFKKNKVTDENAIQESIWVVTNSQSISNVYLADTATNRKLKTLLGSLTKREVPWHTSRRNIQVDPLGNINTTTTIVQGNIRFNNPVASTIKSKVINEAGETKFENSKSYNIPKANNVKMKFKVGVSGWVKGKYFVIYYTTSGTELLKKEFIIS